MLWKSIEEAHKVIIEMLKMSGGIIGFVKWKRAEELVEFLKGDGHG